MNVWLKWLNDQNLLKIFYGLCINGFRCFLPILYWFHLGMNNWDQNSQWINNEPGWSSETQSHIVAGVEDTAKPAWLPKMYSFSKQMGTGKASVREFWEKDVGNLKYRCWIGGMWYWLGILKIGLFKLQWQFTSNKNFHFLWGIHTRLHFNQLSSIYSRPPSSLSLLPSTVSPSQGIVTMCY